MMARKKSVTRSPSEWQLILDDQQQSDLSPRDYCLRHQITPSTFYVWRRKLRLSSADHPASPITPTKNDWVDLTPPRTTQGDSVWEFELTLPGGVIFKMTSA